MAVPRDNESETVLWFVSLETKVCLIFSLSQKTKNVFSLLTSSPIYFVSEDPLESSGLEETHCSSLSPQPYLL